ncbi:MAG: DUF2723 domain-containing protein [Patescibacteria group bacterium]
MLKIRNLKQKLKLVVGNKHFFPLAVLTVFVFSIYLSTMPPGFTWEHWGYDAGDLISCVYTWGIPHPSGTPLYVLVGQIFRYLPFLSVPAVKFNFMSVFFAWAALIVLYTACFGLTQRRAPSFGAVFLFAFSQLFWEQSIIAEVLTLNLFLISLVFCLLIWWEKTENNRLLYIALFFFALAITNHLSSITIAPAILFLVWSNKPQFLTSPRKLGFAFLVFVLGLLPFVYLPIRASMQPSLNWGDPSNLERFINHVTAKEYQEFLFFKDQRLVLDNVFRFLSSLWRNFSPVGLLLAVVGLIYGTKDTVRDFLIFAILFQAVIVFNYNIVNIETYYLPVFAVFVLFVSVGILDVLTLVRLKIDQVKNWGRRIFLDLNLFGSELLLSFRQFAYLAAAFLLAAWPVVLIFLNYEEVDLSSEYTAYNYGRKAFSVLEPNAIVLTEGDNYTLGLTYFRYVVFPERKDVAVINEALFYKLGWLLKQTKRNWPDLYYPDTETVDDEDAALEALLDFIEGNMEERPIYLAAGDPPPQEEFTQRSYFADHFVIKSTGPLFKFVGKKEAGE